MDEDNQRHEGDDSESSLLIHKLGPDVTINCLLHCSRSDYGIVASLNRAFRSLIRSGELYKIRREMGIVEHWVYFACDLQQWEAFDPFRSRWMTLPVMPTQSCFMCCDKESLAVGTDLLVFGRDVSAHAVYKYSILTNTWSLGTPLSEPRCLFGSVSQGNIAIVAGGSDSLGNILSTAELYNSDTCTWETIPSLNKARKMCSGFFMDGKFYVIGGIGPGKVDVLTCGEVYDLKRKRWEVIPNMYPISARRDDGVTDAPPSLSDAPPLVAVVDNELYAAHHATMHVKKYDKRRNLWITVGRLPPRALSMNGWGVAFRACGNQIIVIGGPRDSRGVVEINSWVPSEGPPQWRVLAQKRLETFVYNCAVMGC